MNRVHGFARRYGLWLAITGLIILFGLPPATLAAGPRPVQSIDVAAAKPRAVEPTTAQALQRDYAHAWQSLISALEENRADLLNEDFIGDAQQQWRAAIRGQQQNGLNRRIVDRGHQLRVSFYSPDGSSLEAIDTADLEIEYREGNRTLSTERVHARYLVLFTPAANSWKVRVLQELTPG